MKQRIITAIIALIIFIPTIIFGGIPFLILTLLIAMIGLLEFIRASKISSYILPSIFALLFLILLIISNNDGLLPIEITGIENLFIVLIILLLTYTVLSKNKFTFTNAAVLLLGTVYISVGFYFFLEVRSLGLQYLIFVLAIIWTTDSGAYFSGRYFGKRKLWPAISPNKTIEGALGGLVLSVLVSLVFHLLNTFEVSLYLLVFYTLVISVSGQLGDLVASALKRHFSVKDFGNLLPGHGGILDRFDSLLFVLPILYVLQFI